MITRKIHATRTRYIEMNIEVYHLDWDKVDRRTDTGWHLTFRPTAEAVAEAWKAGLYKKVVDVPMDKPFKRGLGLLDQAFEATNTINEPWFAKFPGTPPTRSTSVGDIIVMHGVKYFVDLIGFTSFA